MNAAIFRFFFYF
ncbi:TPA: pheST operon leader peptide PheM, partial [Escherichia coli]|nr:pheST operon leader peptide PheM [Escherichia coli]HAV2441232.1 pheST operon leader peptide PheM [Escherichia coli]HBM2194142.1 pheST operon leader peptide PheM [Escherichia coli]